MISKVKDYFFPKERPMVFGLWDDEALFLKASQKIVASGYKDIEAITPYPVHHLDKALNLKRSSIPWVTFIFGLLGFGFGTWFTWWTSAVSWPINIGGKPMWSLPAFVPIIFELTILFAALSSVGALIVACGLPRLNPKILDPDLTSHKFALMVFKDDSKYEKEALEKLLKAEGAESVKEGAF